MRKMNLVFFCACYIFATGCSYRGAVYCEYQQTALDIRATAASGAPVQVNFGYDRGVFAYVPKQNGQTNSVQGEAVSVVSWNNMQTELNPTVISTNSLLRLDAGFISGVAADVVAAPDGSTVTIIPPTLTNAITVGPVSGDPGTRVAAAIGHPTSYGPDNNTALIQTWLHADPNHKKQLTDWMAKNGYKAYSPTNIEFGSEFATARAQIIKDLDIK